MSLPLALAGATAAVTHAGTLTPTSGLHASPSPSQTRAGTSVSRCRCSIRETRSLGGGANHGTALVTGNEVSTVAGWDPGDRAVRGTHKPGEWHEDACAEEGTRPVSRGPAGLPCFMFLFFLFFCMMNLFICFTKTTNYNSPLPKGLQGTQKVTSCARDRPSDRQQVAPPRGLSPPPCGLRGGNRSLAATGASRGPAVSVPSSVTGRGL